MGDAVNPANLPIGLDMYAGYDDGIYNNVNIIRSLYPGKTVLSITTNPNDSFGDCLDVEKGDANPIDAPGWVRRRRLAGHDGPLVYCNEATWGAVKGAFAAARTAQPSYWVAGYPGLEGDAIPVGAIGHQWIDHNGKWDESCMVDYLPGIDPLPKENKDMELYVTRSDGTGFIVAADLSHKVGLQEGVGAALQATGAYGVVPQGSVPDTWINNIPTLQNV